MQYEFFLGKIYTGLAEAYKAIVGGGRGNENKRGVVPKLQTKIPMS